MANQSSSYPILCASFNQDNSRFVVGTRDGFRIFNSNTGKLLYERAVGAFIIVEMLFSTSLLAIVGAGEQPSLSPRRLVLFNTTTGTALRELNFLTSVVAVRLNKKRLVVVLQDNTYIYDVNTVGILDTIDTVPNPKGICAFSPSLDGCFLALPASKNKGTVLVYNVMELHSHCEIDAHCSPLAAIVLSSNGMYIATASEHGTIIRVHLVSDASKSYSFRRGTYASTIFSLSFGPSLQLPDFLAASSSSGSLHVFSPGIAVNQRSIRSNSFLGAVLPASVNDVLDPAHHLVLHDAIPAGVKSYAVIRNVDKDTKRATISIITFNGYFQEYNLSINEQNEASWSLEREFNLLMVGETHVFVSLAVSFVLRSSCRQQPLNAMKAMKKDEKILLWSSTEQMGFFRGNKVREHGHVRSYDTQKRVYSLVSAIQICWGTIGLNVSLLLVYLLRKTKNHHEMYSPARLHGVRKMYSRGHHVTY